MVYFEGLRLLEFQLEIGGLTRILVTLKYIHRASPHLQDLFDSVFNAKK
jgi:hypothetical protein